MKKMTIVAILILVAASFMLFFNVKNSDDAVSFTVQEEKVALSSQDPVDDAPQADEGDNQGTETGNDEHRKKIFKNKSFTSSSERC